MSHRLLSVGWVIGHVAMAVVVVVLFLLGMWQLDRLAEVRRDNERLEQRLAATPADIADLDAPPTHEEAEALEFRRVRVSGTYAVEDEVLLRSRSRAGQSGFHVVTPLVLDAAPDGGAILVNRGWVPFELDQPPVPEALPPGGDVEITGILRQSTSAAGFGPRDPAEGRLDQLFHADVGRIDQQTELSLYPMVLQLIEQTPEQQGRLPIAVDLPSFDAGTHLSYALQWFSFALIALVGYAALLRTRLRESTSAADASPNGT